MLRARDRGRLARVIGVGGALVVAAAAAVLTVAALDDGDDVSQPAVAVEAARGASDLGARDGGREAPAAERPRERTVPRIEWRRSRSVGVHTAGKLVDGVRLPREGRSYFSWDPIEKQSPNRAWRRWGNDRLIRVTLAAVRGFAADHPKAPRVGIGDLSRRKGGDFGPKYGLIGHASHQNGLDVDVYYPRLDRREKVPKAPDEVDVKLAQDLVDRFVDAGAEKVFVGPSLGLEGPPEVVVPLANHDNHLHARLPG